MALGKFVAASVIAALCAQPCLAAGEYSGVSQSTASAFAGLHVWMPLGTATRSRPTARLQLTSAFDVRDELTNSRVTIRGPGLELGAASNGTAQFYLNGRSTADLKSKLGMSGTTKTLLIVGGVVGLAVVVLAAVAGAMPTPGPREGDFN